MVSSDQGLYFLPKSHKKDIRLTEACIAVLRIQGICLSTSRDIGYYPFYFQGYGILCSIFLFTFGDIGYFGKITMGIFAGIWDTCPFTSRDKILSRDMRFPTMWYVRTARPQTSLRICAV